MRYPTICLYPKYLRDQSHDWILFILLTLECFWKMILGILEIFFTLFLTFIVQKLPNISFHKIWSKENDKKPVVYDARMQ